MCVCGLVCSAAQQVPLYAHAAVNFPESLLFKTARHFLSLIVFHTKFADTLFNKSRHEVISADILAHERARLCLTIESSCLQSVNGQTYSVNFNEEKKRLPFF